MASNPLSNDRFWLLADSTPEGPFSSKQIHDKLRAKQVDWQTLACRFGENAWRPLVETPGIGPQPTAIVVGDATAISDRPQSLRPRPAPVRVESPTTALPATASVPLSDSPQIHWATIVACAFAVALVGWIGYSWLRPYTPREVCERFGSASTAQDAKRFCTSNLFAAVDASFRQQQPNNPKDSYEITQETQAPPEVGGYLVGFRVQLFIPAERRKMQIDGLFHVVQMDGLKIEDMYLLSVDRQPLPAPVSMAADYIWLMDQPPAGGQNARANPQNGSMPKVNPIVASNLAKGATKTVSSVWNSKFGKWFGGIVLAVGAVLSGIWKGITGKKKKES